MLDLLRINDRLLEIRRRLRQLQQVVSQMNQATFLKDDLVVDASERQLEVAIQACLDIAAHIISQSATEKPQRENKELFAILAKMDIISPKLSLNLQKMAGMRNILAHEYLEIDKTQVYRAIKENLPDIVHYCQAIEVFLQKQNH